MSPTKEAVSTKDSPAPLPQFSQAIKYGGMVYCSGSIGISPVTRELAKGGVQPETVRTLLSFFFFFLTFYPRDESS
jgi:enamine deaminase RidA (YjgF/YER057c/UK114 family)